jgi:hypothetical protein
MTILEQAEQLRQQAISLLIQERETIEEKLNQLGANGQPSPGAKKVRACSKCGSADHNSRTCKVIPESTTA